MDIGILAGVTPEVFRMQEKENAESEAKRK